MALNTESYQFDHTRIPGLWQPLIEQHLPQICEDYNKLPTDDVLLKVEEKVKEHLPQLEALFRECQVEEFFALCILHRHFKLPDGYNQVGRTINGWLYFTRKVANSTLNSSQAYGSRFVLTPQGWRPCEVHEGSMPDLSTVKTEFFKRFTAHLVNHDLTSIFGFEYIVREVSTFNTLELSLPDYGLIVVRAASVPFIVDPTVTTRWIWSHPIYTRELKCIPVPSAPGGHELRDVKPARSYPGDDKIIAAFEKEYHAA